MRRSVAFLLVAAGLLAGGAAFHAAQPADDDEQIKRGRTLVGQRCVQCHTLDVALSARGTTAEWRATVDRMVALGARVSGEEASAIAAYLGTQYGPAGPGSGSAAASDQAGSPYPDGAGRDVLMRLCFQCHTQAMWKGMREDRRGWEAVLYRMIGRGALWTEDEIEAMAGYLAGAFGPGAAPKP